MNTNIRNKSPLARSHMKEMLRRGTRALEDAVNPRRSGTVCLHNLDVCLEAASPGEIISGGEGWTITAGVAESPFGKCFIAENPRGLCALSFADTPSGRKARARLREQWPNAHVLHDDTFASNRIQQIFKKPNSEPRSIKVFVKGTDFQIRVWRALLKTSPGTLISYGALAEAAGYPAASRAAGTAVGQNPVAYLIPCHRVIRSTGAIGNYGGGVLRKQAMIAWESTKIDRSSCGR